MWRHLVKWLGPLCSLLLLGTALAVLYHLTHSWHWHDIRVAIWSQPLPLLAAALLLTLFSYACLCCYDLLALHALGKQLPWQQVGITSFIAYTFSNTLFMRGSRFYNFQGLRRYKEKFSPHWEPRYLLCSSKLALPRTLTHLITLISRGPLGLIKK